MCAATRSGSSITDGSGSAKTARSLGRLPTSFSSTPSLKSLVVATPPLKSPAVGMGSELPVGYGWLERPQYFLSAVVGRADGGEQLGMRGSIRWFGHGGTAARPAFPRRWRGAREGGRGKGVGGGRKG
jgi:hypothetical protein